MSTRKKARSIEERIDAISIPEPFSGCRLWMGNVSSGRGGEVSEPIPMILTCPSCGVRHVDRGEFATKVHHTHACQHCGMVWRPAVVPTVGVQFLPGFKDEEVEGG